MYVQAPQTGVLLQPRSLGTWWAVFARAEATPASLLAELLQYHVATYPAGVMFIGTHTLHTGDNMFIRAHQDQWELAHTPDNQPQESTTILASNDLSDHINTILEV